MRNQESSVGAQLRSYGYGREMAGGFLRGKQRVYIPRWARGLFQESNLSNVDAFPTGL